MALSEAAIPCLPMNFPASHPAVGRPGRLFLARAFNDANNPQTTSIANRCRRIWFLSVMHDHRPVAVATASIDLLTAWAAD